ncbi:MAG: type IV pilus secretin PilQ [Deltaproteobacteria bacterium]|nr:type IV pilus secretin PilQ [Deltaproteobacteria bacterium]
MPVRPRLTRANRVIILFLPVIILTRVLLGTAYGAENASGVPLKRGDRLFSIEVRDAEIADVLKALAQQGDMNIILGPDVAGKISVSFKEIGFKDAIEMIIKAHGLTYTVQNNILWAGKRVDTTGEMVMETVRLNYGDAASAAAQVKGVMSADGNAIADQRTGAIFLRDLPVYVQRAKSLLKTLDAQTPQVVIEARIVEAANSFARELGIQWGGSYTEGKNVYTGSSALPASPGGRNFAVNLPSASTAGGLGLVLGNLSKKLMLDVQLSAAESRGEVRIISSPKISTINNKPAAIHSGLTFRVKSNLTTTGAAASTAAGTGLETIKTGIDLTVTPRISDDDYILMQINTTKSDPDFTHTVDGIPGVSEKSASTYVLVKDGDTVVIGGLYKSIDSEARASVPFLEAIPLIGVLFKNSSKNRLHEELLVFITPRIVKNDANTEVPN